ncbi:transposase [Streptomyces sp. NPDC051636]|uniref:transposase n=1 Tax=Streptomyces sp. NPDC051636 TaxID=3365663 RepID=UPI0037BA0ED1
MVPVYGRAKQGAAFGYTKTRGYHPQLATLAQSGQVLFSRLHGGSAGAARAAKSFLTETISRTRHAGASGQLTVRADSAFYSKDVLLTARKLDVRFSITIRQTPRSRRPSPPSPTTHGRRSRTGCPPPKSPARTSPRPPTPASRTPRHRSQCG